MYERTARGTIIADVRRNPRLPGRSPTPVCPERPVAVSSALPGANGPGLHAAVPGFRQHPAGAAGLSRPHRFRIWRRPGDRGRPPGHRESEWSLRRTVWAGQFLGRGRGSALLHRFVDRRAGNGGPARRRLRESANPITPVLRDPADWGGALAPDRRRNTG